MVTCGSSYKEFSHSGMPAASLRAPRATGSATGGKLTLQSGKKHTSQGAEAKLHR
jgi:hypothetical protein